MNYLPLVATILFGMVSYVNVKYSLVMLGGGLFTFLAFVNPWILLTLFVMIIPLSNMGILDQRIGGIPGLELSNAILFLAAVGFVLAKKHFNMPKGISFIITLIIVIQLASFVKSLPQINSINFYFGKSMSEWRYFVSYFLKDTMYIVPVIMVMGYLKSKEEVFYLNRSIQVSLIVISATLICVYAFQIASKGDLMWVRYRLSQVLGLHTNYMSMFYVYAYPFLLTSFLRKRDLCATASLFLSIFSVLILYSRTAYLLIVIATALIFITNKNRYLVILLSMACILILSFSGATVKERAMRGVEEGDIGKISAGRTEWIWPAVFESFQKDPESILFGHGRYSMIYASSEKFKVSHPHNMYLEALIDSGVVGMVILSASMIIILRKLIIGMREVNDESVRTILKASIITVICYLISGVSGRSLFLSMTNSYLWLGVAIGMSILKVNNISLVQVRDLDANKR